MKLGNSCPWSPMTKGVSADELVDLVEDVGKIFNECDNANDHYPDG